MFGERRSRDWENYPTGALREAGRIPAPTLEVKPRGLERKVDLRADMSPVVAQDPLNSCNACSIVAALEYFLRKDHKRRTSLSILFLYYNARKISRSEQTDKGLLSAHAMAGLMAYGVCEDKHWPYVPAKVHVEPPKKAYDDGKRFEAVQYARLANFNEVKALLSAAMPVTVGSFLPRRAYKIGGETGRMPEANALDRAGPGHSMLIAGYDEGDKSWLVRNSWGTGFAENGYVRVPYSLMEKFVWHEDLWAVGALEKVRETRLFGGGAEMESAWRDTVANAPAQHMAALEKLKQDLRRELSDDVEDAKDDFRRRVAQQPQQAQQPGRFGDVGGSGADTISQADRLQHLKEDMREDQQRDLDDAKRSLRDRLRRSIDDDGGGGRGG